MSWTKRCEYSGQRSNTSYSPFRLMHCRSQQVRAFTSALVFITRSSKDRFAPIRSPLPAQRETRTMQVRIGIKASCLFIHISDDLPFIRAFLRWQTGCVDHLSSQDLAQALMSAGICAADDVSQTESLSSAEDLYCTLLCPLSHKAKNREKKSFKLQVAG